MNGKEKCGDFEIYEEEGWWVIRNVKSEKIIGKFLSKNDALDKVAAFFQEEEDIEEDIESSSVC